MPLRPRYTGLIDKYRERLPVSDNTPEISLGEGNTPLIQLQNIPKIIGKDVDIYVKFEGLNPTGSFKDRGMTMAVSKAVEDGSKAIICASTGNTSAAAAAYAGLAQAVEQRLVAGDERVVMLATGSGLRPCCPATTYWSAAPLQAAGNSMYRRKRSAAGRSRRSSASS